MPYFLFMKSTDSLCFSIKEWVFSGGFIRKYVLNQPWTYKDAHGQNDQYIRMHAFSSFVVPSAPAWWFIMTDTVTDILSAMDQGGCRGVPDLHKAGAGKEKVVSINRRIK